MNDALKGSSCFINRFTILTQRYAKVPIFLIEIPCLTKSILHVYLSRQSRQRYIRITCHIGPISYKLETRVLNKTPFRLRRGWVITPQGFLWMSITYPFLVFIASLINVKGTIWLYCPLKLQSKVGEWRSVSWYITSHQSVYCGKPNWSKFKFGPKWVSLVFTQNNPEAPWMVKPIYWKSLRRYSYNFASKTFAWQCHLHD